MGKDNAGPEFGEVALIHSQFEILDPFNGSYSRLGCVKAKRIREQKNYTCSEQIVKEGRKISGPLAWYMGQVVVEARDLLIYTVMRRRKHPKNVYS